MLSVPYLLRSPVKQSATAETAGSCGTAFLAAAFLDDRCWVGEQRGAHRVYAVLENEPEGLPRPSLIVHQKAEIDSSGDGPVRGRGSVFGMDFAYCDFAHRLSITARRQPSDPLPLDPTH